MKINFSKQQYKDLLASVTMANTIHELLSDTIESEDIDYEELAERTGDLEEYLLEFADAFDLSDGSTFLTSDDDYETETDMIMDDFEEYVLQEALPNILAWRDFNRDYTDEEQEKMEEENGNFFGVELFPYEERYMKEFEEYGFNRLFIKDDGKGEGTPSPYL